MNLNEVNLIPVSEDDFDFLFELRKTTMDPHLTRQGIHIDEEMHIKS